VTTQAFELDLGDQSGSEIVTVQPGIYMCDGHTRRLFYKLNPEQKPNHQVIVHVYTVDNAKDYVSIYNAYDSPDSVETSSNKVTGAFRAVGILDKIASPTLKRGGVGSAINLAYPFDNRDPIINKVAYFKDELLLLDRIGVFTPSDNSLKFQTLWASALIFAKLYAGDSNSDTYLRLLAFLEGVARIRSDDLSYGENKWDGLTAMLYELFFPGKKKWIPEGMHRKTSYSTVQPQMNFMLYCMIELYMNDKKLCKQYGFRPTYWDTYTDTSTDEKTVGYYAVTKEILANME
jgi:hypothetical protein